MNDPFLTAELTAPDNRPPSPRRRSPLLVRLLWRLLPQGNSRGPRGNRPD